MNRRLRIAIPAGASPVILLACLVACGQPGDAPGDESQLATEGANDESGAADDADGTDGAFGDAPTWHQDIAPLVATECRSCHTASGVAFSMDTYEATRAWAPLMALATQLGDMPPWHALETAECTPPHAFEHDARLSEEEIQLFGDWAAALAPEGDPALAAELPPPMSTDISDPSVAMTMGGSLTIEATKTTRDFFHCMSFDPGNTEDVYVDAMQVTPGNTKVAHHVLIYVDATAESAQWPDGISEDCGGGAGISAPVLVGAWIPGSRPIETPDDVGIRLPAGARLVFNMHYHADPTGPQTDDATTLALRWTTTPPAWVSEFRILGNPGAGASSSGAFIIPAGATEHEEVIEWVVPDVPGQEARIWAVGNHMHKVGVGMRTSLVRNAEEECLVETPAWDYDWQRLYEYDVPIAETVPVSSGDVLRVRCRYDNSMDNPQMLEALQEMGLDAPRDVVEGDGTLDEMCTAGIGIAVRL
jgi:hypothetical protein